MIKRLLVIAVFITILSGCSKGNKISVNVVGIRPDTSAATKNISLFKEDPGVIPIPPLSVLLLNGEHELEIDGAGVFEFDKRIGDNQAYEVTFSKSPYWQTCLLDNPSGAARGNVVINMTCTDKGWSHPVSLSDAISPSGSDARDPRVAMDDYGNAIIVWRQKEGSNDQIFMSQFFQDDWKHPSSISDNISPGTNPAWKPHVAMDNYGNAIIVWAHTYEGNYRIFKSEYHGGIWTHPEGISYQISPGVGGDDPFVVMSDSLNSIIVWVQFDSYNRILKSEYRDGRWSHPADTDDKISPSGKMAYSPKSAVDNYGNTIVAWYQADDSNPVNLYRIFRAEFGSLFVGASLWSVPANLNDNISGFGKDAINPQTAMNDNASAMIVWQQIDDLDSSNIYMSHYRLGQWNDPGGSNDKISPDGGVAQNPSLAMDDSGDSIIVWAQNDGSNSRIYKSEFRKGNWTHPSISQSISPSSQDANMPNVAVSNNGEAMITWHQQDSSGNGQIFLSQYRYKSWIHPENLSDNISPDGKSAQNPQVAMSDNGDVVVVWEQRDSADNWRIFMSHYR